jgi:hypothetical protein
MRALRTGECVSWRRRPSPWPARQLGLRGAGDVGAVLVGLLVADHHVDVVRRLQALDGLDGVGDRELVVVLDRQLVGGTSPGSSRAGRAPWRRRCCRRAWQPARRGGARRPDRRRGARGGRRSAPTRGWRWPRSARRSPRRPAARCPLRCSPSWDEAHGGVDPGGPLPPATFWIGVATRAAGPPMASSARTTVSHSTVALWASMSFSASWRTLVSPALSASTFT